MKAPPLLIALLACGAPAARTAQWERDAAALEGKWSVRFEYAANRLVATGSMDFTINRSIDRPYPRFGIATDYGTYAVAFPGLGGPPSGSLVPATIAGVAGDSVFVLFETDREAFSMQMRGALTGDSVRGSWVAMQSRGTIASGNFTMIRR